MVSWGDKQKLFLPPDSNTLINVCGSYASIAPIFLFLQIEKYYNQWRKQFAKLRLVYNTRKNSNVCFLWCPRRKFVARNTIQNLSKSMRFKSCLCFSSILFYSTVLLIMWHGNWYGNIGERPKYVSHRQKSCKNKYKSELNKEVPSRKMAC